MVSRPPQKPKDCAKNHDLILDAAQEALREYGFKRMTMDDLAARAGLGKGTLYLYFESKDDVALSVIDRFNVRLQQSLNAILTRKESASSRLQKMLLERVMYRFECVQGYSQGLDELFWAIRPQLQERREKYHHVESLIFAELLIEGRTVHEFCVEDPFATAEAFITATNSLLPYSLCTTKLGPRECVLRRTEVLSNLLLRSVQNPESQRSVPVISSPGQALPSKL